MPTPSPRPSPMLRTAAMLVLLVPALPAQTSPHDDWPDLARYREANAQLGPPKANEKRVVFMGDSITDSWAQYFKDEFPGKPYVGRGISGQTTPQMLVRFRQDVVALQPAAVLILAGTNDIAGNTGPSTLEMIEDNLRSMTEIAQANGMRVVLCSVLPAAAYPWRPDVQPAPKIVALNAWIRRYASERGLVYLDYFSALADEHDGMKADLSRDGVHPNEAGYRVMAPLAEKAIAVALTAPPPAIVPAEDWGSKPQPIPAERRHQPVRITIHHAGVLWKPGDDPYQKIRALQAWGQRDKGWPDVPYHFLVAPDGRIFEGRSLDYEGETNTEYDTRGHALVQVWGDFEKQRVTQAQLESVARLCAWLCASRGIDPKTIAGHRDWSKQTTCPGRDLYRYVHDGDVTRWVEALLHGEPPQIVVRDPLPDGPTELVPMR